jgi:spoIIIJ-associated protein
MSELEGIEDSVSDVAELGEQKAEAVTAVDDAGDATSMRSANAERPADREDEGDIAADYIEELLDICDLDGDIDIDVRNDRSYISVHAADEQSLRLLSSPDTVNALQELSRLAVQTKTNEFSRLILDIAGSRLARQQELAKLVDHAIAKIDEGAAQAALPPMSSYERKLIHDIVAERGYVSNSEGEGRDRHTVITSA